MHGYLRSIGFKDLKKKNEIDLLIQDIVDHPDKKILTEDEEGNIFAELTREFSEFTGIAVRGFYIDNEFHVEYYYPYFAGSGISTEERVDIQKRSDREAYAGICDEMRIGVTLIFYLQNAVEYLQEQRTKNGKRVPSNTTISALSASGKIVLPVYKNENQIKSGEKYTNNRNHLMAAARDGDEDAMESLTLEDIDTYSMISRRIMTEDILSIVDTYFMPYGIESDQYSIHLVFDVCINQADLLGEPAVGRRFKGAIWMQGQLNYQM